MEKSQVYSIFPPRLSETYPVSPPHSASSAIPTAPTSVPPDDPRWFAEEVHVYDSQLKAFLRRSFPAVDDVDDVVQESYLRILRRAATDPIRSARAFLFETARNLALDLTRRHWASPIDRVRDLSHLSVYDTRPSIAEAISREEKVRLLAEAIRTLPARCREIFVLRRLQMIPQKEVAARLGLSERTIEVQVQKGLRRCETYLRERGIRGLFNDDAV